MKRKPLYFFTSDEVSVIERLAGRLGGGALGGGSARVGWLACQIGHLRESVPIQACLSSARVEPWG